MKNTATALLAAAIFAGGGYIYMKPRPAPAVRLLGRDVETVRLQFLETVDNLRAIEVQRFVPPKPGEAIDTYSLEMDSLTDRLWDVSRIGLSLALLDVISARTPSELERAKRNGQQAANELTRILQKIHLDEWNERVYVVQLHEQLESIRSMLR